MKIITLNNKPRLLKEGNTEAKPVYLIQQYYKPKQAQRAKEIDMCLRINAKCSKLNKLILLTEEEYVLPITDASKVEQIVIGKRLEYIDVFKYVRDVIQEDALILFANADIFIRSDFIDNIREINMEKTFMGLTRWDVDTRGGVQLFSDRAGKPRPDTQDLWGLCTADILNLSDAEIDQLAFQFGKPGCDNKIAAIMNKLGFYCCNPSLSLKSYHLHNAGFRGYSEADRLLGDEYVYMIPTATI